MIVSQDDHALLGGSADFIEAIAARFPATERPTENVLMGAQEPEWPEDGSLDDLVGAMTAAGTRLPLSSGNPFGDGPVLAFVEFWKAMRDWSGRSNDWLAALVDHLFGEHEAKRLLHESGW